MKYLDYVIAAPIIPYDPLRDVVKVLCTIQGTSYEDLVNKCVEKIKKNQEFSNNPKEGDICGNFQYHNNEWCMLMRGE